jgi:hypothetical protein
MRLWPIAVLVLLAGCALPRQKGGMAEPVMEPVMAPEVVLEAPATCEAGDDDGIGGTGCPVE